ncbi:MAG: glycosyltransferase [Candidatus Daviesbacteria bacterium]|nr:glycosyltransferase [Candidatus Daviesbacteria bacterium]
MKSSQLELSIVVPLYNEEKRFSESFKIIDSFFNKKKIKREYIFVDDGSRDKTYQVVSKLKSSANISLLKLDKNSGKGAALKYGVEKAQGKNIFFTDADLSTPIEEFNKLYPYLKEYEMAIGSRRMHDSNVQIKQPFHRRFLGSIFYFIFSYFFTKNIKDTNCGFKCYRAGTAKKLYRLLKNNRWGFDAELIFLAEKLNYKIKEIPVIWLNDPNSRVSSLNAVFGTLWELIKIRLNYFLGNYSEKTMIDVLIKPITDLFKYFFLFFFKLLFFLTGDPVTSKHIKQAVKFYEKDNSFDQIFTKIRLWDSPYEKLESTIPKQGKIIDLGCGDGFLANYLAIASPKRNILGIEVNPIRIDHAYKGIKNTKFICGDITTEDIPQADVILLVHVLHHLRSYKEQEVLLKKCVQKLKKNGRLIIVEIDKKPLVKYFLGWISDIIIVPILFERSFYNPHIFYRTGSQWDALLSSYNLKVSLESADEGKPYSHILVNAKKNEKNI